VGRPERAATYDFRVFARAAALKHGAPDGEEAASGVFARRVTPEMIPRIAVPRDELLAAPLDHRAGFIVSLIDGVQDVETILDVCAMRRLEALKILSDLATMGVIALE